MKSLKIVFWIVIIIVLTTVSYRYWYISNTRSEFRELIVEAENGDYHAQFSVGSEFLIGGIVDKDIAKAIEFLLLASENTSTSDSLMLYFINKALGKAYFEIGNNAEARRRYWHAIEFQKDVYVYKDLIQTLDSSSQTYQDSLRFYEDRFFEKLD